MKKTFPADMDPACVPLCTALCALPGVETTESCEGHGKQPPWICFRVRSLAALHPIVRAIDPRYYGTDPAWELVVGETDLVDDRLRFVLQTVSTPSDAAAALAELARSIDDAAECLAQWEIVLGRASRLRISVISGERREVREVVVLPGVAVPVADVDSARVIVTNPGTVMIYLGLPDVSPTNFAARVVPGGYFDFLEPPAWPLYAIAEDPPRRVAGAPVNDDVQGEYVE